MRVPIGLLAVLLACGTTSLAALAAAPAAEPAEVAAKRSDLEDLTRRIRDLQKEIAGTEESRSSVLGELAAAERAVSDAQRRLRGVAAERAGAEKALAILEAERAAVEQRIAARQGELGEWVRRHYVQGAAEGVAPLLSTRDPNQLARDAYYLEHLGRARLALIESLRGDLKQKAQLGESIAGRRDRLAELEQAQRTEHATLEAEQARRKLALAGISEQLRSQRKEERTLREDQERLGQIVAALAKRAAEREAARAAAAREAAARVAAAAKAAKRAEADEAPARKRPEASNDTVAAARGARSEAVVGEVRRAAEPTPTGVSFAQLRGKLRFPVRGELVGRFGAPRAEGGTTWRGVFIRATGGAEVRAVAGGEVVFSDWLRGYGNLIIVDHGNDYLSIYGNNDALLKELGDEIAGGEPIASVGSSGGASESGLYFEIRYRGQPLDPMQWVRLN